MSILSEVTWFNSSTSVGSLSLQGRIVKTRMPLSLVDVDEKKEEKKKEGEEKKKRKKEKK